MSHAGLIIVGIIVVLAVRLTVGYWAAKRVKTTVDYVVAGRRLPWWMAAPSIMATWFAGETMMGASSQAYQYGFAGVVFDPFGTTLCLLLAGVLVVKVARRAQYLTVMDFFERRFGKAMSVIGTITQIITYFGWTAAQIVAGGAILQALLGWPPATGMILVAAVVTLYTMAGGLWADTALDFMQMFLTCCGLVLILAGTLNGIGGLREAIAIAGAQKVSHPHPFAFWPTPEDGYFGYFGVNGWFYYLAAWLSLGLGSIPAQDYLQRTCAAKDESTAVKSTFVAAALYISFGVLSPLIGVIAFGALGPGLGAAESEFVLISMAARFLPPILAAVFVAMLASALMSAADSSMLAGATMFTENLVKPFKPDLSDRSQLLLTRLALAASGTFSLLIALFASTIYELAVLANSSILVGMAAPYIIGMHWKRANHAGALASFFAGVLSWIGLGIYYYHGYILPVGYGGDPGDAMWDAFFDTAMVAALPALLLSVFALIAVSLLTQKQDPPKQLTDIKGRVVDMTDPLGNPFGSKVAVPHAAARRRQSAAVLDGGGGGTALPPQRPGLRCVSNSFRMRRYSSTQESARWKPWFSTG